MVKVWVLSAPIFQPEGHFSVWTPLSSTEVPVARVRVKVISSASASAMSSRWTVRGMVWVVAPAGMTT